MGALVDKAVLWDGGPVGLERSYFPNPKGWTFAGASVGQTLERVTVRLRTALHRQAVEREPTCVTTWPRVLKSDVPMREVWRRFSNPLLTPRDYKSQFRVIHRSMRTHNICPDESATGDPTLCRLCHRTVERFSHLSKCRKIRQVFEKLVTFANRFPEDLEEPLTLSHALVYLGMTSERCVLPGGLSVLHCVLWKFVIIAFVQVDTDKAEFKPDAIWKAAVTRTHNKIAARHKYLERRAEKLFNLGKNVCPLSSETHAEPLAYFEQGQLEYEVECTYAKSFRELLAELDIQTSPTKTR